MEETLSPSRPVDSEHAEAVWGQCQRYHTEVNCKNWNNRIQEQLQVMVHYPDQDDGENATNLAYGKSMSYSLLIYMSRRWNFLSNITPKFRADLAGLVLTSKSSMGNIERYFLRCCSFPIRRNSVYLGSVSVYHWHLWLDRGQIWL